MSGPYQHIKMLAEDSGIDLRSSEIMRPYPFATNSQNTMPTPQGGIGTRYGTHMKSSVYGKFGITRFKTTDMLGVTKTEIIGFGADSIANSAVPYRLVKGSFTVTNDHASATATIAMYYVEASSQFRFTATVNGVTEVNQALGVGTEGSPYMLSSLETVVDAAASFSMSTPAQASTTPAAFMELIDNQTVAFGASLTVYYYYWEAITGAHGSTFASAINYAKEIGEDTFENVSTAQINGVLYVAPGYTSPATLAGGAVVTTAQVCKYDGQAFYRAGMPEGFTPGITDVAAATLTDVKGSLARTAWTYAEQDYFCTYKQVDKAGNIVEGPEEPVRVYAPAAAGSAVIRLDQTGVTSITTKGFNYRVGIVNGNQTGVTTITIDTALGDARDLLVGDIAYFWDNRQGRFIQREILSRTATTITISAVSLDLDELSPNYDDGAAPNVRDDATITCNIRVCIWRTKASDSAYYLVDEIPLPASTNFYYDTKTDDLLGAEYIAPAYVPGLPPQGRYIAAYNGQLLISGDPRKPKTIYFSDESPESFPAGTHVFDLLENVSGIHQSGSVIVAGSDTTLDIVEGDLLGFNFRVDRISSAIGVTSHHSMQEIEEGFLAFQSAKGPYRLINGRDLRPLGEAVNSRGLPTSRIEPFFTAFYTATEEQPIFKRAVSGIVRNLNLYLLYVPFEDPAKPGFATSNSVLWVYDYSRDSWRKWTGINAAGGIADMDNILYFASRTHDGAAGVDFDNVVTRFSQQQVLKGVYNYADHNNYIDAKHQYHWEALGEPSIPKNFIRLTLYSHETRDAASTPVTVKTYINYDNTLLSTSDTLTFTTEKSLDVKLVSEKAKSLMLSLESQAYYKPLSISGSEVEASAPFRP